VIDAIYENNMNVDKSLEFSSSSRNAIAELESKKRKCLSLYFPMELLTPEMKLRGNKTKTGPKPPTPTANQLAKSNSLLSIAKLEHKEKKIQSRDGEDDEDVADTLGLVLKDDKVADRDKSNESDDEDGTGLPDGEDAEEVSDEDDYAVDHYASDGEGDDGLDGDEDEGRDRGGSF